MNSPQIGTSPPAFDWYAGTLAEVTEEDAVEYLRGALCVDEAPRLVRGRYGFGHGIALRRGDRTVATVYSGGHNREPFVQATSDDAVDLARQLRAAEFSHRVSRADAKVDVPSRAAYDVLRSQMVEHARAGRAQVLVMGDPDKLLTVRCGAPSSPLLVRMYDKGEEQGTPDLEQLRVEAQYRPRDRVDKERAASISPKDVFGIARWSREFAANALALSALPPPPRQARTGDLDRALSALAHQYGPTMDDLLARCAGDVAAAWAYIEGLRSAGLENIANKGTPPERRVA